MTNHKIIQKQIVSSLLEYGITAIPEYKGSDWRADVFIPASELNGAIAIEIQSSPQSLAKTIERQSKYLRDDIFGCWLFEKPIKKLREEIKTLPLFYIEEIDNSSFQINLGDRRKLHLTEFIKSLSSEKIRFQTLAQAKNTQNVNLEFYSHTCWKCGCTNHLYFVHNSFYSSCGAVIKPTELLWESSNIEYIPEIIALAHAIANKNEELKLGEIKMRYSNTVGRSYMSFGCYNCDSLFGDYHVMESKIEACCDGNHNSFSETIKIDNLPIQSIEHWCLPEDGCYCQEQ